MVREEVKNQSGPVGFGGHGTLSRSKYPVRQETLRPGPEHLGFQAGERAEGRDLRLSQQMLTTSKRAPRDG